VTASVTGKTLHNEMQIAVFRFYFEDESKCSSETPLSTYKIVAGFVIGTSVSNEI
jgi:uncharacterized membrane protein